METTNAFDLNREINRWRQTLGQSPAIHSDNLEELESHLRDSVGDLEDRGLCPEEAFVLAVRRMGPTGPVQAEFAKVNPTRAWMHRGLWILIGIQGWALINGVSRLVGDLMLAGGVALTGASPVEMTVTSALLPGSVFLLSQVLVIAPVLAVCCWLAAKSGGWQSGEWAVATRSTWVTAIALVGLGILGLWVLSNMMQAGAARWMSPAQLGWLAYSKSLAQTVLFVLQTISMSLVTVLLASRLLGSNQRRANRS